MTSKETADREGKGADGRARTREVKLAVFFTQDKLDKDGYPVASDIERREPIPRGNVWTHAVQFSALAPAAGVVGIGDVRNMIGEVQLIDNAERTWLLSGEGTRAGDIRGGSSCGGFDHPRQSLQKRRRKKKWQ